jgi:hypothetical protein
MCKCFGLSARVVFGFVVVSAFMMTAFAEVSSLSSQSILVGDPVIQEIIAEEFLTAISEGDLEVGGDHVKTDGQILSSDEDLKSVLVYGIHNLLNYDFKTDGILRLIGETPLWIETIVTESSADQDVVMRTHITEGKASSGFMRSGTIRVDSMVFSKRRTVEYLKQLDIESYDEIYFLKAYKNFSGILVKTQGTYRILPLELRYVHFKYTDVKVMDADVYFDALKAYVIEQKRMNYRRYGPNVLGQGETNPSQWVLKGVVGLYFVWIVFGVMIVWRQRDIFCFLPIKIKCKTAAPAIAIKARRDN